MRPFDDAGVTPELDEAGLEAWGLALGRIAVARGVFVCLYGELGAGKSTLMREPRPLSVTAARSGNWGCCEMRRRDRGQ